MSEEKNNQDINLEDVDADKKTVIPFEKLTRVPEKEGINNIKAVLLFALSFTGDVFEALQDGKITFWEGLKIGSSLKDTPDLIRGIGHFKAELVDLSMDERKELDAFVIDNFNVDNEKVEEIVEKAFSSLLSLHEIWIIRAES